MIYTFYSYKGGVGRSMALANIAELLYQEGKDVLVIDFDLEAPGLEDYFDEDPEQITPDEIKTKRGIIDLILSYKELRSFPLLEMDEKEEAEQLDISNKIKSEKSDQTEGKFKFPYSVEPISNFVVPIYKKNPDTGSLSIIPAGTRGENFSDYAEKIRSFDWDDFYQNWDGELFFEWFRIEANKIAPYVLVDSRTGVTEMGGACVYQLADTVVSFVTANKQNTQGTLKIANSLRKFIKKNKNDRKNSLVFVPSRVELNALGPELDIFAADFNKQFTEFFDPLFVSNIFEDNPFTYLRIPYTAHFSFKEKLAVRDLGEKAVELRKSFEKLKTILLFQDTKNNLAISFLDEARKFWIEKQYSQAIDLAEKAERIWKELYMSDSNKDNKIFYISKLAQTKTLISEIYDKDGDSRFQDNANEAIKTYLELYKNHPEIHKTNSHIWVDVIPNLTTLANRLHDAEILLKIIEIQRETIKDDELKDKANLAKNLYDLSNWLIEEEQFGDAIPKIKESSQIYRELSLENPSDYSAELATVLITLSECLFETSEINDAAISAVEALEIFKSLSEFSPEQYEKEIAKSYNALLDILSSNKINEENGSLELVNEAVAFFGELSEKDPALYKPDLAKTINLLPEALFEQNKLFEAIEKQQQAIDIFREISPTQSTQYEYDLASSLVNLSRYLRLTSDTAASLKVIEEAHEIYKKLASKNPRSYRTELIESEEILNNLKSLNLQDLKKTLVEKYQSLIDLANSSGVSPLKIIEDEGFIRIEGEASSSEIKQTLWDEYGRIDPDYRSGDLILNISAPEEAANTYYTVQSGDNLSKIGAKYGISWQKIFEANRDQSTDVDKFLPGQELHIPDE